MSITIYLGLKDGWTWTDKRCKGHFYARRGTCMKYMVAELWFQGFAFSSAGASRQQAGRTAPDAGTALQIHWRTLLLLRTNSVRLVVERVYAAAWLGHLLP